MLITGGTQGVGGAIARSIAAAGGDVVLVGLVDDAIAEQTLNDCRSEGVQADLITCDLSEPSTAWLDDLMQRVEDCSPGINALVNNAGTFIDLPFLEMTPAIYDRTMNLNVAAGYFLTQAFARRWVHEGVRGRVVFTGSINGILAEPDHTAYDTSKGAVAAMVRSLCVSLAPLGIRVNSMAPGLVRTPLTNPAIDDQRIGRWMELHTPNGKVPTPDVCGGAVVFLLSDAAEHVHGQTIYVDGGMSIWQQPDAP
ncbi:3-oxoacyl-[acyl-carrier-protein] reductase FabG [Neorhodopirellula pilleata]|uniref:3-oxoacyl-[acyl-carrier-protein] reductase FabG n=1 Tax=Neorhodopirellula pilleata TaxID=2714738 RepID=A0A5C6AEL5_9BACT|nr:3-oxoacyl-[acyl-carrier-protein] reductase FabG [Neorhodopirellula pilleata]